MHLGFIIQNSFDTNVIKFSTQRLIYWGCFFKYDGSMFHKVHELSKCDVYDVQWTCVVNPFVQDQLGHNTSSLR